MEIPSYLRPDGDGTLEALIEPGHPLECTRQFANEFGIDWEPVLKTALCGASHCLGGALQLLNSHRTVEAPFSQLTITPEHEPVWHQAACRFLNLDLAGHLRMLHEEDTRRDRLAEVEGLQPGPLHRLMALVELDRIEKGNLLEDLADQLATDRLEAPLERTPLDRWISHSTPAEGLSTAFANLDADGCAPLCASLLSDRPGPRRDRTSRSVPVFCWQLAEEEAAGIFVSNPWLRETAALFSQIQQTETPSLSATGEGIQGIASLHRDLVTLRLRHSGCPKAFNLQKATAEPIEHFLSEARRLKYDNPRWKRLPEKTIIFGQKIALLLCAVEQTDMTSRHLYTGLEMSKRFWTSHLNCLASIDEATPGALADTTDLSERERAVFLKICENQPVARSRINRMFNNMSAGERDEIVAKLLQRRLIHSEGKILQLEGKILQLTAV